MFSTIAPIVVDVAAMPDELCHMWKIVVGKIWVYSQKKIRSRLDLVSQPLNFINHLLDSGPLNPFVLDGKYAV